MHGLERDLKLLIDQARGSDDPTAADRERVARALAVRIGAGALAATATVAITAKAGVAGATASTAAASGALAAAPVAAASGLGIAAKVVGVVALAGTVGVAATPSLRERMLPSHREVAAVSAAPAASRRPTVEPLPAAAALEREVRLVREAQQAMREGHPDRALALLAEHDRRFPSGLLRQESLAARVMALCALGRKAEARRDAAEFLRRWPQSPLSANVRASCEPR